MPTMTATKESPTTESQSVGQEQKMSTTYTKKWTVTIGKSFQGELAKAKILYDAKVDFSTLDTKGSHERWLLSIRVNESTASMYRLIHVSEFIHNEADADRMPADYTKLYQLARIEKAKGTGKRAEKLFLDALDYIQTPVATPTKQTVADEKALDHFTTTSDLHAFVNRLLEKSETAAKKEARYKGTGPQAARTLHKIGRNAMDGTPDPVSGASIPNAATAPLGQSDDGDDFEEPSDAQVDVTSSWEDDGNDVHIEPAEIIEDDQAKFLAVEIKMMLHKAGLKNMNVAITSKGASETP